MFFVCVYGKFPAGKSCEIWEIWVQLNNHGLPIFLANQDYWKKGREKEHWILIILGSRWPLCYNVSDNYKNFNLDLKGHTLYFSQLVVFSQQFALGWNVMWEAKLKCPLSTENKIYSWLAQWEPQVNFSSNPTLTLTFFQLTVVRVKGGVSVQLLKYWHWCKSSCEVK